MPTLVQNARWIIAWDDASQRHAYLENADLVFHEDRIRSSARTTAAAHRKLLMADI
jgi:hypothetical protein